MQHSWDGYTKYAWGYDELLPGSQKGEDGLCSTGATILDSLDTLWCSPPPHAASPTALHHCSACASLSTTSHVATHAP